MGKKKRLKEQLKEYETNRQLFSDYLKKTYSLEDGRAWIRVDVRESELYNPLSVGAQKDLSPDIYAYIDEKVYAVPTTIPVGVELIGVPEEERDRVSSILREHYDLQLRDKKLDLRINRMKGFCMFAIGTFLLALYFVLANFVESEVWYEVLSIIATVIVWEAAETLFIERNELKFSYYYAAQMVFSQISFSVAP